MELTSEHRDCYASEAQRSILKILFTNKQIGESFYLTGGTALSVFYLGHRLSQDLDLFTATEADLPSISLWLNEQWPRDCSIIRNEKLFLSALVAEVKVDIVIDKLSSEVERPWYSFHDGGKLRLDAIENIVSNKLCTIVSRSEPKDFIDFYAIFKSHPHIRFDQVYIEAQSKEGIFDDYPTSAYQIEKNFQYIMRNKRLWPKMQADISQTDFELFYSSVVGSIYQMAKKGILQ